MLSWTFCCQALAYLFTWGRYIYLAQHECQHDLKKWIVSVSFSISRKTDIPFPMLHAAFSIFFSSHSQRRRWWLLGAPVSGVFSTFSSHPESQGGEPCRPLPTAPDWKPHMSWSPRVPCGYPTNTLQINDTHYCVRHLRRNRWILGTGLQRVVFLTGTSCTFMVSGNK